MTQTCTLYTLGTRIGGPDEDSGVVRRLGLSHIDTGRRAYRAQIVIIQIQGTVPLWPHREIEVPHPVRYYCSKLRQLSMKQSIMKPRRNKAKKNAEGILGYAHDGDICQNRARSTRIGVPCATNAVGATLI